MKKKTDLKNIFPAFTAVLFLICFAVVATLAFKPLYYADIRLLNIGEESGFPEEEIRENYDELISYNLDPFHEKLEFPTFPMSREAQIHFEEVKVIFQLFLKGMVLFGILTAAEILYYKNRTGLGFLKTAGILSILIPAVLGTVTALNWEWFFVTFHEVVFKNDYWLFDPAQDPVILVLPDAFFLHGAVMILTVTAAGAFLMYRAGSKY